MIAAVLVVQPTVISIILLKPDSIKQLEGIAFGEEGS